MSVDCHLHLIDKYSYELTKKKVRLGCITFPSMLCGLISSTYRSREKIHINFELSVWTGLLFILFKCFYFFQCVIKTMNEEESTELGGNCASVINYKLTLQFS